jgi:nucleotide-binding universal stress UspA family protein
MSLKVALYESEDAMTNILTVARSGASDLFIGNTAESMLKKTHRDMFVIKLESFVSPV